MNKLIIIFLLNLIPLMSFSQTKSSSWRYYFTKGKIQYTSDIPEYAIYNLQTALQLNPQLYDAANLLAEIYLKKNYTRIALDYYEKSVRIHDNQPDILSKSGELHEFFGNNKTAYAYFKKAITYNPDHIRANLFLARIYLNENKKELAKKHFALSYAEGDKISSIEFIKGLDAEKKAESYIKGEYKEAAKYFTAQTIISQKKIDFFYKHIEEHKRNYNYEAIQRIYYQLGVIYFKKAINYYKKVLELNPAKIEAYLNISLIFRKFEKYQEAIEYLKNLTEIKPDYARAHSLLGHLYYTRKAPGQRELYIRLAVKHLTKALTINPNNSENLLLLAHIYHKTGKNAKARELEKKAQGIDAKLDK